MKSVISYIERSARVIVTILDIDRNVCESLLDEEVHVSYCLCESLTMILVLISNRIHLTTYLRARYTEQKIYAQTL